MAVGATLAVRPDSNGVATFMAIAVFHIATTIDFRATKLCGRAGD
jgi:hypothetical protein